MNVRCACRLENWIFFIQICRGIGGKRVIIHVNTAKDELTAVRKYKQLHSFFRNDRVFPRPKCAEVIARLRMKFLFYRSISRGTSFS